MRRIVFQLVAAAAVVLGHYAPAVDFAPDTRRSAPAHAQDDRPCVPAGKMCIALNTNVTTDTVSSTICVPGYTAHLRPDSGYVSDIKTKLGHDAGVAPDVAAAMILDHIIPLCLGGHARDPSNLQLQDAAEAHRKDRIELKLPRLHRSGGVERGQGGNRHGLARGVSPLRHGEMPSGE